MKKGKVFGKSQIALVAMVLALGAAVWLNMKFSSSSKYLGQTKYVSSSQSSSDTAVQTSAKASDNDYFTEAKKSRETARTKQQETVTDTLKDSKLSDAEKKEALTMLDTITDRISAESNIETLLKAKGFEKTVVVISDGGVNVVVGSEGLNAAQTLQIQDIVTSQTKTALNDIKIVTVK